MTTALELPLPQLVKGRFAYTAPDGTEAAGTVQAYTDPQLFEATGVRIAFTLRHGGASLPPYASLNLGTHVKDDRNAVEENRRRVLSAFDAAHAPLLVPNQVHGRQVQTVDDAAALPQVRQVIAEGADALVVPLSDTAALLCFADCVPLIMVAPHGAFAVVHAGWRGVDNRIAEVALADLLAADGTDDPGRVNVYRGAYIHAECFETGPDVYQRFIDQFGPSVAYDATHIDMGAALDLTLTQAGVKPERIADVGCCTMCDNQDWFSYRAEEGTCGRHGAFAVRRSRR